MERNNYTIFVKYIQYTIMLNDNMIKIELHCLKLCIVHTSWYAFDRVSIHLTIGMQIWFMVDIYDFAVHSKVIIVNWSKIVKTKPSLPS